MHGFIDNYMVAEAEIALMHFLWALLFLPAMAFAFHYAWAVLLEHCYRIDTAPPRSQRALLRQTARYKPKLRRLPYWIRKKRHLYRRIQALRRRRGGYYYTPQHTFFSPYMRFKVILFIFKCLMTIEMFMKRIHFKFFRVFSSYRDDFSDHIVLNARNLDTNGPIMSRFDTDSVKIGIDNHASRSLSPNMHHFEDLDLKQVGRCKGLGDKSGEGLTVAGKGTLVFTIQDDDGSWHVIKLPDSLYVPSSEGVLISPQHWAQMANDDKPKAEGTICVTGSKNVVMYWRQRRFKRTIPLDPSTNTPIFYSKTGSRIYQAFDAEFVACDAYHKPLERTTIHLPPEVIRQREADGVIYGEEETIPQLSQPLETSQDIISKESSTLEVPQDEVRSPDNIRQQAVTFDPELDVKDQHSDINSHYFSTTVSDEPEAQDKSAELMRWHYRLGHMSFHKLQQLAKMGEIPRYLAKVTIPKCAACLFGGMTKVPWRRKPKSTGNAEIFVATAPGQVVSVDQMVSTLPGFIAQMTGRLTKRRYTSATIFVDHFSRLKFVFLMQSMTSEETIRAKEAFERFASNHGVVIKQYHADNGRFKDNAFINHCNQSGQQLTFCGVNAHFQNGIAEKAIRDLSEAARKQLLFAKSRWPDAVDMSLWPYALRQAAYNDNVVPRNDEGLSKLDLFGNLRVNVNLSSMHTFGCPVYVLDSKLASGKSIKRWDSRARVGLNLGHSPDHARNVSLVLSLTTGLVSPQFHCNFDDFFETVSRAPSSTASNWRRISFGEASLSQREPSSAPARTQARASPTDTNINHLNGTPIPTQDSIIQDEDGDLVPPLSYPNEDDDSSVEDMDEEPDGELMSNHFNNPSNNPSESLDDAPSLIEPSTSSRGRLRFPSQRLQESAQSRAWGRGSKAYYMAARATADDVDLFTQKHDEHLGLQDRMRHPIAFHAEMCGDIMYYHQAMRQDDADEFKKAVEKEVNGHVENGHWKLIKRSEIPEGHETIPSVWSMRRKRDLTTNEIKKYKARLNVHGGKQTYGVNYFETYAPVVTWFAIRLMIVFGIIFNWSLKQIDFVMAYPQAPIETDLYMDLPHGIDVDVPEGNSKDYALALLKNVYGQKQAGRVWNQFLVSKLEALGFRSSLVDDCVFYRGSTIFICYVDDGIALDLEGKNLDEFVKELSQPGIDLNVEDMGHPNDYVGVNIQHNDDGTYQFAQTALIDSIIADCGLTKSPKKKQVPAKSSKILHHHLDSPPFDGPFNYRSVIGKLNYVSQTTRPDIQYAVHSCAKFSSNPRKEHGLAVLDVAMYLKATRTLGLKFKPDPTKGFEDYVDADFCGNWRSEDAPDDPSTAKSRAGWIVFYAGCPIIWASKLMTQVTLSTTESEYVALSMSLRDVIPAMELVAEMKEKGFPVLCTEPHVYCKVFEDNSGALELARLPKFRPRTKHINVAWHHFRDFARHGLIKFFPIDTELQPADVLTKPLPQNLFVKHRQKILGH